MANQPFLLLRHIDLKRRSSELRQLAADLLAAARLHPRKNIGQVPDRRAALVHRCRKRLRVREQQLAHVLP